MAAAAPQILPIVPRVPVPCIRPVPLPGVSVCLAQSYDSLVSSQGAEDTNYNSISFPRNHCAKGWELCGPSCSRLLQLS